MNGIDMSNVSNYKFGSLQVDSVYLGSNLIWPKHITNSYFYICPDEVEYSGEDLSSYPKFIAFELLPGQSSYLYYSYDSENWLQLTNNDYVRTLTRGVRYNDVIYDYDADVYRINVSNKSVVYFKGQLTSCITATSGQITINTNTGVMQRIDCYRAKPLNGSEQHYGMGLNEVGGNILSLLYNTSDIHAFVNASSSNESHVYSAMFAWGTSSVSPHINNIHNLLFPTNTLPYCYEYMFAGIPTYGEPPILPALDVARGAYKRMFGTNWGITKAPALPATTLAQECYKEMFYDCAYLNNVTCLATDISATDCTLDWLYQTSASGTFTKAASMNDWTTGTSGIPNNWSIVNAS